MVSFGLEVRNRRLAALVQGRGAKERLWRHAVGSLSASTARTVSPKSLRSGGCRSDSCRSASLFLVVSTWINVEAGMALGDICSRFPELTSFPLVVASCFGRATGEATLWVQYSSYWLTNVYNFVIASEYLTESGVLTTWCEQRFMFLSFALIVPLLQLPDYHAMALPALASNAVLLGGVVVIFYVAWVTGGPESDVDYGDVGFSSASRGGVSLALAGLVATIAARLQTAASIAATITLGVIGVKMSLLSVGGPQKQKSAPEDGIRSKHGHKLIKLCHRHQEQARKDHQADSSNGLLLDGAIPKSDSKAQKQGQVERVSVPELGDIRPEAQAG